jgi:hypothetical protein
MEDVKTMQLTMGKSFIKESTKITQLIHMIGQLNLTGIYRVFHPAVAQYTFFSAAHGTFFKMDHILDHKASPIKCKLK